MLELCAIRFHGVCGRTIPLRRNETVGSQFQPPEWTSGKTEAKDSPAAYMVGGGPVQVRVRLHRLDAGTAAEFDIGAQDASADGNFLVVRSTRVVFRPGEDTKFVDFPVASSLPDSVACHDDLLCWWASLVGGAAPIELRTTSHRIYTILAAPGLPWGIDDLDPDLWVWTDVLDLVSCWANRCSTQDEAANAITDKLHALGDVNGQGFVFSSEQPWRFAKFKPFSFDCSLFLQLARRPNPPPRNVHVDCLACSSILTTLANSLGCRLWGGFTTGATTTRVRPIGEPAFSFRIVGPHELVAKGVGNASDRVWDGCFRLAGNGTSGTAIGNLPFDTAGMQDYVGMLFNTNGRSLCTFVDRNLVRVNRAVIAARAPDVPIPLELVQRLGSEAFRLFMSDQSELSALFTHNFFWTFRDVPGFHLLERLGRNSFRGAEALFSEGAQPGRPAVRVAIYEAASRFEAREIFAARLLEYTQPVTYLPDIGEVAFHDPESGHKVAMAGNTIWTSTPAPGAGLIGDPVFRSVGRWLRPSASVSIPSPTAPRTIHLTLPTDPAGPVWYVLRPQNGVLSRDASGVVFTPSGEGAKSVDVAMHRNALQQSNSTIEL